MIKIYDRVFQGIFSVGNRFLKHIEPEMIAGAGSLGRIPEIITKNGIQKPMVVTGPRIGKSEQVHKMLQKLSDVCLYAEVKADPPISQIEEMAEIYRKNQCDGIIAIGGGSNMDAAKAMGARLVRPKKSIQKLGGVMKVRKEIPFFIAVPTTAGTGSECTVAAVVTDDSCGKKYAINDPVLCPKVAVLDAELTKTLPKELTAYTGMDALTHAVEAYLNKPYHIHNTKEMAETAIRDIFEYLPQAYENGENLIAREKMLLASYRAGIAFTVACVGNIHAIAHTYGGQYHIQHGLANAVIMPYVLEEYLPKEKKELAKLCDIAGIACDGSDEKKAKAFIQAIRDLNRSMNIPEHFSVIEEDNIEKMAKWADQEANPLYPCPVLFDRKKFGEIMRKIG